jgi:hypothetical protein
MFSSCPPSRILLGSGIISIAETRRYCGTSHLRIVETAQVFVGAIDTEVSADNVTAVKSRSSDLDWKRVIRVDLADGKVILEVLRLMKEAASANVAKRGK